MLRLSMSVAAMSFATAVGLASGASAQAFSNVGAFVAFPGGNRGHNVSVLQRERPEYSALGLRAGSFQIFPRVDATFNSLDNVFATEADKKSDTYFDVSPSLSARSDWSRHSVNLDASLISRNYSDYSSENYDNWRVAGSGRLDMGSDSSVSGGVEAKRDHITRDQISFPTNGAEPVGVTTKDGFLRGVYQANRLRLLGNVVLAKVKFGDISSRTGGVVDQSGRDFDSAAFTARGDYALSPDTAVFAEAKRVDNKYDTKVVGQNRDSKQTEVLFGGNFDLTSLARGEIGVGYLRREYDDPNFRTIKGTALRGTVEYFPTPLTTITLTARRSVEDSILAQAGGYLSTYGSARVDHELLRNVLLYASVGKEKDNFRGADRKDSITDFAIGATYLVNHYLGVSGGFTHRQRDSNGAASIKGPSFNLNRFALTLTLQR